MAKVFVVYDSKYGNTKLAAESVLKGIKAEAKGINAAIGYVNDVNAEEMADYDLIFLGAPNHMGRPSRMIKKFVDKLAGLELKANCVAIFGTYAGRIRTLDRAVNKMEEILKEKLPNVKLISSSLSIRVNGVTGPIVDGELPKCVDFGKKIAGQF